MSALGRMQTCIGFIVRRVCALHGARLVHALRGPGMANRQTLARGGRPKATAAADWLTPAEPWIIMMSDGHFTRQH
jgi:hypothetical protein